MYGQQQYMTYLEKIPCWDYMPLELYVFVNKKVQYIYIDRYHIRLIYILYEIIIIQAKKKIGCVYLKLSIIENKVYRIILQKLTGKNKLKNGSYL